MRTPFDYDNGACMKLNTLRLLRHFRSDSIQMGMALRRADLHNMTDASCAAVVTAGGNEALFGEPHAAILVNRSCDTAAIGQ